MIGRTALRRTPSTGYQPLISGGCFKGASDQGPACYARLNFARVRGREVESLPHPTSLSLEGEGIGFAIHDRQELLQTGDRKNDDHD